jgi:1-acyl-sn-glycerol-3-phosphate acyltransferase
MKTIGLANGADRRGECLGPRLGIGRRLARAALIGAARLVAPLTVEGADRLPADRPLILTANHGSHLDAPLVLAALPKRLRDRTLVAAAADYFYRDPLRAALAGVVGAYPFARRGGPSQLRASLDRTASLLDAGWSVLLFPEGTRSRDGCLAPFRAGAICLAGRTGAPIVPVALVGAGAAWPPGRAPRRAPVVVRFGHGWRPPPGDPAAAAADLAGAVAALADFALPRAGGPAGARRAPGKIDPTRQEEHPCR